MENNSSSSSTETSPLMLPPDTPDSLVSSPIPVPPEPPKPNSFFKILFFISLIIFLTVLTANIYIIFPSKNTNNSKSVEESPTTAIKPTNPPTAEVCELNNTKYTVGQTFTATDGCNVCTCTPDLIINCTTNTCPTPTIVPTTKPTPTLPDSLVTLIKTDAATKNKVTVDKVTLGDFQFSGNYAKVAVSLADMGGYGVWVTKQAGVWKIIAGGQEPPYCTVLNQFKFPKEFDCQK